MRPESLNLRRVGGHVLVWFCELFLFLAVCGGVMLATYAFVTACDLLGISNQGQNDWVQIFTDLFAFTGLVLSLALVCQFAAAYILEWPRWWPYVPRPVRTRFIDRKGNLAPEVDR